MIGVFLSVSALLALAGGALALYELVRTDPLQPPGRLTYVAFGMVVAGFVALTAGYVAIVDAAP